MSAPDSDPPLASTHPYLIRALYEWCADNGLTPYIAVRADAAVQVPREYVRDGEIVLNISADATSALMLDNDYIRFKARFDGVPREIIIPVDRVMAIYARENGQGMAFVVPEHETTAPDTSSAAAERDQDSATALSGKEPSAKEFHAAPGSAHGGIQLVPTVPGSGDDPEPPTPPRPRPALKRVK